MHFLRISVLAAFSLLAGYMPRAQVFGGNPASLKWKQLNNDTVRIIYPEGLARQASEIASTFQWLGSHTQWTLGNRLRKINLVLQTQPTISNAYVGLGPFRSEFYLTPLQNSFELGSLPWHQSLALHEYRHVQQYNNFRKGWSKVFYFIAGELGQSFANSTALPNWFWEGDAVFQETHASFQGRGRMPYFFNGYHSLWGSGKNYSWMKLRNGSYRDYVPDHYQLGYLLTAYGREKYGPEFWGRITDDAVRFKGIVYPFQRAIRRQTGMGYLAFRDSAIRYFKSAHPTENGDAVAEFGKNQKHFAGDEEFPQWMEDGRLLFVKSSYRKIPAFVIRDLHTGKETILRVKDISLDNYFSYRNGRVVYAAWQPDARWGWREYSVIRLLNTQTGRQRTLGSKTRYFAPDISDDGSRVVVSEVAPGGDSRLLVIETLGGGVVKAIPRTPGYFYTYPKFAGKDSIVSAVRNATGQMALLKISIQSGSARELVPFSNNVIGFPQVQGDTVSFSASRGKQDELFIQISDQNYFFRAGNQNRITGNYQLATGKGGYAYTGFTSAGYRIWVDSLTSGLLEPIRMEDLDAALPDYGIHSLESDSLPMLANPKKHLNEADYPKSFHLFNFHSWLPDINDPEYSIFLQSENILNTLLAEVNITYNTNEQSKQAGASLVYGAWFPWVRMGGSYTLDRNFLFRGDLVKFNQTEGYAGLELPLNLSRGRFYRSLQINGDWVYSRQFIEPAYKDSFDKNGFSYLRSRLSFINRVQQARQHIYPRFAQTLQVDYAHTLTVRNGSQVMASANWYFPGLFINHSLRINTAIHNRDTLGEVSFSNTFPFSRGYIVRNFKSMYKLGINYQLPIFYPDRGFASIVYLLRVRLNGFYDFTRIRDYNRNSQLVQLDYRSFGGEIFFDTRWWNQHPVSFGLRFSRLPDAGLQGISPNQWEFILPVNLTGR